MLPIYHPESVYHNLLFEKKVTNETIRRGAYSLREKQMHLNTKSITSNADAALYVILLANTTQLHLSMAQ